MKKRLLVGKIIGILGLCIFAMGITYIVMHYVEREKYGNVNLLVTFEDNKEFTLENTNKLTKEEALDTYPYIFTIENKGTRKNKFKINIKDELSSNLSRKDLDYIIVYNDKEVKSGNLDEIDKENNLLYEGSINSKAKDTYKVYIYLNTDIKDISYTYSLLVESK